MSLDGFLRDLLRDEPWRRDAKCRGAGPDAFFPGRGESQRQAKAMCAACPVTGECASHAEAYGEEYGIWGGAIRRRAARRDLHGIAESDGTFTPSPASEEMGHDPEESERFIGARVRGVPRPLAG